MLEFLAQTTQSTEIVEFPPLTQITSIAGVAVATMAIMSLVIKKYIYDRPYFNKIPAAGYVVTIALVLTFAANRIFHTLPGSFFGLAWHAASAALASSGGYSWCKKRNDDPPPVPKPEPTPTPEPPDPPAPVVVTPAPLPPLPQLPSLPPLPSLPSPTIVESQPEMPTEVVYLHIRKYEKPKPQRRKKQKPKS